ncbi:MAG: redoxin domain-containing protein [Deltaproteobacteria bacterium]|nr:redoxin domain-containing protein [Deltaproteobacteria bacterium]
MSEILRIGQKLPDLSFEAYDPDKREFVLKDVSEFRKSGKWFVFFFYPADFTFVCPTELKDLSDKYEEFKRYGVEVVSFSADTKYVHLAWKDAEPLLEGVKFLMGADPNGKIAKLLGVYDEETGLPKRGTFIFNPEGQLVSIEISYDNVGRNADELLRKIKAHIYLSKHPDEACPAKWSEGDKTLKPSPDIVGRVGDVIRKGKF